MNRNSREFDEQRRRSQQNTARIHFSSLFGKHLGLCVQVFAFVQQRVDLLAAIQHGLDILVLKLCEKAEQTHDHQENNNLQKFTASMISEKKRWNGVNHKILPGTIGKSK